MCLAVPGKIVAIDETDSLLRMATVDFGGVKKPISLAYITDAAIGDFVLVHVGFAISKLDAAEADKVFEALEALGELPEFGGTEQA